ncbi:MAG: bifunctional adenosylcobinamide kinase/adenosylcobinamide-phosphate guanylyltransferase [Bacillota bacterium]
MSDQLHKSLILGGTRSGKSTFAEEIAYQLGKEDVTYIATAKVSDLEMQDRIDKHQQQRPSQWRTIEEPYQVADKIEEIAQETEVILIDCLTILVSNLLLIDSESVDEEIDYSASKRALDRVRGLGRSIREAKSNLIIVSNEVGQGVVPSYKLGRIYRDTIGQANQIIAQAVSEVYITYAGLPVEIKELGERTRAEFGGTNGYDS